MGTPFRVFYIVVRIVLGPAYALLALVIRALPGTVVGPAIRLAAGPNRICPHCGLEVGGLEASCSRCGFNPSVSRASLAMSSPSGMTSSPAHAASTGPIVPMGQCPNCEEIIPMSSRSCPVCRYSPGQQGSLPA